MHDILFNKVFKNNYLKDYIFKYIKNNNSLGYKRQFNEIKSLKWMIKNKEYSLIIDKLSSDKEIIIDNKSIEYLITKCKQFVIFELLFKKKREYLESISRDLLEESIKYESLFAFESFTTLYELEESDEQFNGDIIKIEKHQNLKKDYYQHLLKYSISRECYSISEYILNRYQDILNINKEALINEWGDILDIIFQKKNFNLYLEFIINKIGFNLDEVVKEVYKRVQIGLNECNIICKINNKNHLLSFLNNIPNDQEFQFNGNIKKYLNSKDKYYINPYGIDELKCRVYLLLFIKNYSKPREEFNDQVTNFEDSNYTITEILENYKHILRSYYIDYCFYNQQYEKLTGLIINTQNFMQLVILSNINFSLEGIQICSTLLKFKFEYRDLVNLDFLQSLKSIEDESELHQFYGYFKHFENKTELLLTRYYSSYSPELFIISDYYSYNHKDEVETSDLLFSFQHKTLDQYNNDVIKSILLPSKLKEINVKLLSSILTRINNLDSSAKDQLLNDLLELNKDDQNSIKNYKDKCIRIWYYLYKNQIFKNIKSIHQLEWHRNLVTDFKIGDDMLSSITDLFINQVKIQNNESLDLKEVKKQLEFACGYDLYQTFNVLFNVLYPNQENEDQDSYRLKYEFFSKSKQNYLNSLTFIQKFKYGYINEETINNLIEHQILAIHHRKDVYSQFLSNANNYQVGLFFKKHNELIKTKDDIVVYDLLKNDRFEILMQLYNNQIKELNLVMDTSIRFSRYDIIEYFINSNQINNQTVYKLDQLFNKSKNNDYLVLFKLLLNHYPNKFNINNKLLNDLISTGSINCFKYIMSQSQKYKIKFSLNRSNKNTYINQRSNYLIKKQLLLNNIK